MTISTSQHPTGAAGTSDLPERFRRATGRIPSPVTVITALDGSRPVATTVATLVPASNEPPLLLFLASATSASARAVIASGAFGVNVLARGQEAQCYRFAASGADKFAGLELGEFPSGIPMLPGCVVNADCTIEATTPAGDHTTVLARVTWFDAPRSSPVPLVLYRSRLSRLDAASGRHIPTESLHWW